MRKPQLTLMVYDPTRRYQTQEACCIVTIVQGREWPPGVAPRGIQETRMMRATAAEEVAEDEVTQATTETTNIRLSETTSTLMVDSWVTSDYQQDTI